MEGGNGKFEFVGKLEIEFQAEKIEGNIDCGAYSNESVEINCLITMYVYLEEIESGLAFFQSGFSAYFDSASQNVDKCFPLQCLWELPEVFPIVRQRVSAKIILLLLCLSRRGIPLCDR